MIETVISDTKEKNGEMKQQKTKEYRIRYEYNNKIKPRGARFCFLEEALDLRKAFEWSQKIPEVKSFL